MLCVVYVLRRKGERLPVEEVRARPHVGWLTVDRDVRVYYPQEAARLFRSETDQVDLIEPMVHPRARIKKGCILLRGSEDVRSSVTNAQAWWCVPGPLDDRTEGR